MTTHTYRSHLIWSGSTGAGYAAYCRDHEVVAAPADQTLGLSSDTAFGGDPARLNPEQLLVAAASSCQLLSFLAVAARARLDVVAYVDDATGTMPTDDPPIRITRVDLRPSITLAATLAPRPTEDRLHHLCEVAHRECFIANSLRSEVVVTPTFTWAD